jgi:zinc/manganese transport system substrate-binding protein
MMHDYVSSPAGGPPRPSGLRTRARSATPSVSAEDGAATSPYRGGNKKRRTVSPPAGGGNKKRRTVSPPAGGGNKKCRTVSPPAGGSTRAKRGGGGTPNRSGSLRRAASRALLAAAALALASCGSSASTTTTSPTVTVVATTTILGDLATHVVGDRGVVEVLMPVNADPHDFSASSRQVARMQEADLILATGLDFEEALIDVLEAVERSGTPVIWLAEALDPLPFADEDDDGDDHGDLDPHVWMDPLRMSTGAELLAEALTRLAPEIDWKTPAEAYGATMVSVDAEIQDLVAALPQERRLLVTNHHALGYFAERYGFTVVGTVIPGGTTLGAPSSAELAHLVDLIERLEIPAIFAENIDATALADALAAEIAHPITVVVLATDSLGEPGTEEATLAGMLLSNARLIVEALSG